MRDLTNAKYAPSSSEFSGENIIADLAGSSYVRYALQTKNMFRVIKTRGFEFAKTALPPR